MSEFLKKLKEIIPEDKIMEQEPMSLHTTFRIGGPADLLIRPTEEQLIRVVYLCRQENADYTVIGNGSNLLVGDQGIRGLVIEIGSGMSKVNVDGDTMTVQAGSLMASSASEAAKASLSGMEFAHGIPGTLGGAVVMNAGAYGSEMKDIVTSVRVLDTDGTVCELSADELELGYRHSCIPKRGCIILSVKLQLVKAKQQDIYDKMKELRECRVSKQPLDYPSAGSTFKRPEGHFAGKLIQDCNLKGYTVGGARVSEKHSGFVINAGGATASDVRQLMLDVQKKVKDTFQVELEPEVKFVGEF